MPFVWRASESSWIIISQPMRRQLIMTRIYLPSTHSISWNSGTYTSTGALEPLKKRYIWSYDGRWCCNTSDLTRIHALALLHAHTDIQTHALFSLSPRTIRLFFHSIFHVSVSTPSLRNAQINQMIPASRYTCIQFVSTVPIFTVHRYSIQLPTTLEWMISRPFLPMH